MPKKALMQDSNMNHSDTTWTNQSKDSYYSVLDSSDPNLSYTPVNNDESLSNIIRRIKRLKYCCDKMLQTLIVFKNKTNLSSCSNSDFVRRVMNEIYDILLNLAGKSILTLPTKDRHGLHLSEKCLKTLEELINSQNTKLITKKIVKASNGKLFEEFIFRRLIIDISKHQFYPQQLQIGIENNSSSSYLNNPIQDGDLKSKSKNARIKSSKVKLDLAKENQIVLLTPENCKLSHIHNKTESIPSSSTNNTYPKNWNISNKISNLYFYLKTVEEMIKSLPADIKMKLEKDINNN